MGKHLQLVFYKLGTQGTLNSQTHAHTININTYLFCSEIVVCNVTFLTILMCVVVKVMMIIDTDGSLNICSCGAWCCAGDWVLTSAGIVLHQELVQGAPASSHSHHHSGPQNTHKTQLLRISKLQIITLLSDYFISYCAHYSPCICPRRPGTP